MSHVKLCFFFFFFILSFGYLAHPCCCCFFAVADCEMCLSASRNLLVGQSDTMCTRQETWKCCESDPRNQLSGSNLSSSGGRFKKEIVVDGQSYLLLIRDEGGPPELQVSERF